MSNVVDILGPKGPFVKNYKWFRVRECQQEMSDAVDSAIAEKQNLIAESGTGTGKTFAYLVPSLLSEKKIIISTRTKNLQEQLFRQDVGLVCEALGLNVNVQLLKGRENYFCIHRYKKATRQMDMFGHVNQMERVHDWVQMHDDGDISEQRGLSVEARQKITSTAQNCVGGKCEYWNECYVNRRRIAAKRADVLIVNHALLCSHLLIGRLDNLSPEVESIIVDEAHRFPEIAAEAMGTSISTRQLRQLCSDCADADPECNLPMEWLSGFDELVQNFIDRIEKLTRDYSQRAALRELAGNPKIMSAVTNFRSGLTEFASQLEELAETWSVIEKLQNSISTVAKDFHRIFEREDENHASWFEKTRESFKMAQIPLEPGQQFAEVIDQSELSLIFTSATLAVGKDFSFFKQRMGLEDAVSVQWASPFDYWEQTRIYFPPNVPNPSFNFAKFDIEVAQVVKQVVAVTQGRTLVLFTSYKSLNKVYEILSNQIDYTLLRQESRGSNAQLLQDFCEDGNAVLLGTSSFWEGIDVRGDTLSCVVITKLPFGVPSDPVLRARERRMQANNENFFMNWSIPEAALTFKQGVGRLIRDVDDKGILVICDPRILTMRYGKHFLDSLPKMQRAASLFHLSNFLPK